MIYIRVGGIQSTHPNHSTELQIRSGWLNSSPCVSSKNPLPLLNMMSSRFGEFRSPTPIIQRNFGIVGGDWIQFHLWAQVNHSHHTTWYPFGLGNSEHPPSLLNMISTRIGELRAPTPVTRHDIHYGWGIQSTHPPHHSTWYPLGLGISAHPLPLLNMIFIRVGEFRAPTPFTQQNFGIVGGDSIEFHLSVQITHSHHSTWYPLGLGNSEHPPSWLNMISTRIGEFRAPTPVTWHDIN